MAAYQLLGLAHNVTVSGRGALTVEETPCLPYVALTQMLGMEATMFGDPNDARSYEDWMNDMATNKPQRMPRGWQAQYQLRCDCCGKFVRPGEPGGSWVMVPGTDWNAEDERERCPACTEKHGQARCGLGYVEHLCCGMNAMPNV